MGQPGQDERTRKVSWDEVRHSAAPTDDGAGAAVVPPGAPVNAPAPPLLRRMIHLATKCATTDDFVHRYAPFVTADSIAIPTGNDLKAGDETRFLITLKGGSPVMRGKCAVIEVRPGRRGADNKTEAKIVRVRVLQMDAQSRAVHQRLLEIRSKPTHEAIANSGAGFDAERTVEPSDDEPPSFQTDTPTRRTEAAVAELIETPSNLQRHAGASTRRPVLPPPFRPVLEAMPVTDLAAKRSVPPPQVDTLPVNPLEQVRVETLSSFIDSKLYEEDPNAVPLEIDDPADNRSAPRALLEAAGMTPTPMVLVPEDGGTSRADGPPDEDDVEPTYGTRTTRGEGGRLRAGLAMVFYRLSPNTRRHLMRVAPFALCSVVSVVVGIWIGSASRRDAPGLSAAVIEAAPAVAVSADVVDQNATGQVQAPPAAPAVPMDVVPAVPMDEPASDPVPAASGHCVARVEASPRSAAVLWAGRFLGNTPLVDVPVPCGPATVVLQRDRFDPIARQVVAQPGERLMLTEKMERPLATIQVTTAPVGAMVAVNGQLMGRTPRGVTVPRFETARLLVSAPGHRPWKTQLYVKGKETHVHARLDPAPGAGKRGKKGD